MDNEKTTIEVQMHYSFFDENFHSMNAIIFNDCERNFIDAIQNLDKYLDFTIEIEVFAKEDGSLKGLYKIVIKKNPLVLILITAAITAFFTSTCPQAIHHTEETKNKLETILMIKEAIQSGKITLEEFDYITRNDKDLNKFKSNFFETAKKEEKIKQIVIESNTPINGHHAFERKIIAHEQFDEFIIKDEFERNEYIIDAKIYIVAPVLVKGRRDYWKGILDEEPLEFQIMDKNFLNNVYNHSIKFSSGTYIHCKLKIVKKINSRTHEEKLNRRVIKVINWGDNESEVKQIKKHITKKQISTQLLLPFDDIKNSVTDQTNEKVSQTVQVENLNCEDSVF
jgi:hypothetical protein